MRKGKSVVINEKVFPSNNSCLKYYYKMLNKYNLDELVSKEDQSELEGLIKNHYNYKMFIRDGIHSIRVLSSCYNDDAKMFEIIRLDGSTQILNCTNCISIKKATVAQIKFLQGLGYVGKLKLNTKEADDLIKEYRLKKERRVNELKKQSRFFKTQTELGEPFGISAVVVGKFLIDEGLRVKNETGWVPSKEAVEKGWAVSKTFDDNMDLPGTWIWDEAIVNPIIKRNQFTIAGRVYAQDNDDKW